MIIFEYSRFFLSECVLDLWIKTRNFDLIFQTRKLPSKMIEYLMSLFKFTKIFKAAPFNYPLGDEILTNYFNLKSRKLAFILSYSILFLTVLGISSFVLNDRVDYQKTAVFGAITPSDLGMLVFPAQGNERDTTLEEAALFSTKVIVDNNHTPGASPLWVWSIPSMSTMGGTVTLTTDTTFDYDPPLNFFGEDSIFYEICAPPFDCVMDTFFVTVLPVNDLPIPQNDTVETVKNVPIIIDVQANDMDIDDDSLITMMSGGPPHGTVTILNTDSLEYVPNLDYLGLDTINFNICDTTTAMTPPCVPSIAIVKITSVPIAKNDTFSINEDSVGVFFNVLANDMDADMDSLMTDTITGPKNGTAVVVNMDSIQYTPDLNYNGLDSIQYIACEDLGFCDTAWIIINIIPVNDRPIATLDSLTIVEDSIGVHILADTNDTDIEMDTLSIRSIITAPIHGTATIANDDSISYVPDLNYTGLDSLQYELCDSVWACDTAWVILTITPINDPPIANTDFITIAEDSTGVHILADTNDTDIEMDTLSIRSIITAPIHGTATIANDDSISYMPDLNYNGLDSLQYELCDSVWACDTAWIYITINPVNDSVVAVVDSVTVTEDTSGVTIAATDNDIHADTFGTGDSLKIALSLDGTVLNGNSERGGTVTVVGCDSLFYTPAMDTTGLDSIKYYVCDTSMVCDSTWVIITIMPINDPPIANMDLLTIREDSIGVHILVDSNDFDLEMDTLSIDSILIGPIHGVAAVINDDSISYMADLNYNGLDSLQYRLCDSLWACDTAWVYITITPVNDSVMAMNDFITITEDTMSVKIAVLDNDLHADTFGMGDTLAISVSGLSVRGAAVSVIGGDSLEYMPDMDTTGLDSVKYYVCDTLMVCDSAWLVITILPENDLPVALPDSIEIDEDSGLDTVDVQANDFDIDDGDTLVTSIIGAPNKGVAAVLLDSLISYLPDTNAFGIDTILYQVCDIDMACATSYVIIKINPINDPPTAVSDTIVVMEDVVMAIIPVQANDSDIDGDLFATSITQMPINGAAVVAGGNVNYTPDSNFVGMDTIAYRICDAGTPSLCDTATIFITVTPVNDAPIANNDTICIPEDTTVIAILVKMNDMDVDGDPFGIKIINNATKAQVDSVRNDTIIYLPSADSTGMDSIYYEICDASLCDSAWVLITIKPVNDPPVGVNDSLSVTQDTVNALIDVLSNDIDIDVGDSLKVDTVYSPTIANGIATVANGDSIAYTPMPGFNGIDSLYYVVCDTSLACDSAIVIIAVGFVNRPPIAQVDSFTIKEDSTATFNVLLNDTDINGSGDTLKLNAVTSPAASGATVSIVGDSSVNYIPVANFNGIDSFTYTVCDTLLACTTAKVYVTLDSVNDKPVAVQDLISLTKDTVNALIDVAGNDTDVDGDVLTVDTIGRSTQGVLLEIVNDSIKYSAPGGFLGLDTVIYTICDPFMLCDTSLLIIGVADPNNIPPVAVADFVTTDEGTAVVIDVQDNDIDLNGDALFTSILAGPSGANTVIVLNGDSLQYTPAANFVGKDTIVYQICDPSLACDQDTVFITVENELIVSARAFLEGPYDSSTTLMHDSLRKKSYLPRTEPYSTLPALLGAYQFIHKNQGGGETVVDSIAVFADRGDSSIVDWVYMELLTEVDTMPIASRAALIRRDGNIVDVDGISAVKFANLPDGDYFLSIRHRNHLGIMTKDAVAFSNNAFTKLDFTQQGAPGTEAYGKHAMDTIGLRLVLWGGDANSNRTTIFSGPNNDRDAVFFDVFTDPANTSNSYNHIRFGYFQGDTNMNGQVVYQGSNNDIDALIFFNVLFHEGNITKVVNYIIEEQIPR